MALGRTAFLNSLYMVLGNGGQLVASLGVFLYLARVLSPADFGAMGIAAALVDLLTVFGRFGQVEALLQHGADDQRVRSTSFWILTGIGVIALGFILAVIKPFTWMTGTTVVGPVLLILAVVPLISNLGQVNEAIVRRELRYSGLAIRNVLATVIGAAAAVALAIEGYGVYALAVQKLVFTIVYTGAVLVARPWLPGWTFLSGEARRLLSTGLDVTISNTLQMANGRIVDLSIGTFLGVVSLGITRVAWRLYDFSLQLVIAPLSSVSYSLFTGAAQNEDELRRIYLQYVELIVIIAAPIFIGISIVSRDAIILLAGAKWESSAFVLSMLSLTVLASCISLIFAPVMVAKASTGLIRRQAIWQAMTNVAITIVAAQFSILAVVLAYMARMYAFAAYNMVLMNGKLGVANRAFLLRLLPIVTATAGLAMAGFGVRSLMAGQGELARLCAVGGAGAIAYVGVLFAGDALGLWRGFATGLFGMARNIFRRKKAKPSLPVTDDGETVTATR